MLAVALFLDKHYLNYSLRPSLLSPNKNTRTIENGDPMCISPRIPRAIYKQ